MNPSTKSEPPQSSTSNNKVYRYFSKSAKKDSELFNYKNLFEDIINDYRYDFHNAQPPYYAQPIKKSLSESKLCPHPQAECTRCRKKLNIQCNECKTTPSAVDKVIHPRSKAVQTTTHNNSTHIPKDLSQNEMYNEHDLPISKNQQVVIYRSTDQHTPYSFNNIEQNSAHFVGDDTLEDLRKYSEQKLANYRKNYGSLKKRSVLAKDTTKSPGMVASKGRDQPKDKVSSLKVNDLIIHRVNRPTECNWINSQLLLFFSSFHFFFFLQRNQATGKAAATRAEDNAAAVSALDDIFQRAQITTITQVGLARKHLAEREVQAEIH